MKYATILMAISMLIGASAYAAENCGVFLSKSAGFEHSCIKWDENKQHHVGNVLTGLQKDMGIEILLTKDGSLINAENLKKYKVVIFYTTGDLTTEGGDKQPAMSPTGQAELLDWIGAGGGFIGYHCASDSFHQPEGGDVTPYVKMLGGEFRAHHKQFAGTLKIVDPSHPTMANVPADWNILDEWYLFRNLNAETMHVLALLDPGPERQVQEQYNIPSYPIVWCSAYGKGRVYYNAMGHREDVWDNPIFQKSVVDAVHWVMGHGPAQAEPNLKKLMSDEDLAKAQAIQPAKETAQLPVPSKKEK
ncbi:MAG: ThuA domain-containing protein [Candidatus Hydrogenedentes bacterium]|nr:ThuA domain-containing protein [Candidatus Hydrogenedentota bacterium]